MRFTNKIKFEMFNLFRIEKLFLSIAIRNCHPENCIEVFVELSIINIKDKSNTVLKTK